MPTDRVLPERKRNRLPFFDYSENGGYFLTICTKDRSPVLSRVVEGNKNATCSVELTSLGQTVDKMLNETALYYGVTLVKYVIMPNHIHVLLQIEGASKDRFAISRVIKHFKTNVTRAVGASIWQKSFYDHIIRDVDDFNVKYIYIDNNPANWLLRRDEYHPDSVKFQRNSAGD